MHGNGEAYDIYYDDGDTEIAVRADWVHGMEEETEREFASGSLVEALFGGGEDWFTGKVVGYNREGTYVIDYDDGDHEDTVPPSLMRLQNKNKQSVPVEASMPPTQVSHNSVYARFGGGEEWFLADIVIQHPSGACDLHYHDGDVEHKVDAEWIRPVPDVGDAVEGRFGGGGEWHTGKVVSATHDGFYDIDYDDGDQERSVEAFFVRPLFDPSYRKKKPVVETPKNVPKNVPTSVPRTVPKNVPKNVPRTIVPVEAEVTSPSVITPSEPSTPNQGDISLTPWDTPGIERTLDVPDSVQRSFTEKEIEGFRQVFALYDADNSGAVDREELSDIMEQLGETPDKQQLDMLIEEADEDGDGEIDFQEFCNIMQSSRHGAFGSLLSRADKQLNPTGVFREYALPAITKLHAAVAGLKQHAARKGSNLSKDAFDPVEEMLRLVPICWQRSEKLIGLGMVYRSPPDRSPDGQPKNLREKVLSLTEKAVAVAKTKLTKDKVSSPHLKCLFELIAAVKWLSIDFTGMAKPREDASDTAATRMEAIKGSKVKILNAGAVALPGMGSESDRNSVRLMSAKIMIKAKANEKSLTRKQSERSMRLSEAEYGPSGNTAAVAFMEGCREGLLFFSSKLKSPIQLDASTEEGKLDALNRQFASALSDTLDGLTEYVRTFHPDGLRWQWQKVISKEESDEILEKSMEIEKSSALSKFKAAGKAVQAANRFSAILKEQSVGSPLGSPTKAKHLGEGIMRLGGTLFRQTLPEDICVSLEAEGEKALSDLAWPKSDAEQNKQLFRRVSGVGMEHSKLLGKMSFWDDKVSESNQKKIVEEKSYEVTAERRRSSNARHADEKQETMDVSTANALILSACSDTTVCTLPPNPL